MNGLNNSNGLVPKVFYLGQNYPNPFKNRTIIKYCVCRRSKVLLTVYDSKGEEIKRLVDEKKEPGTYEVEFSTGSEESNNKKENHEFETYTYRLEAGDYRNEKIMILQK